MHLLPPYTIPQIDLHHLKQNQVDVDLLLDTAEKELKKTRQESDPISSSPSSSSRNSLSSSYGGSGSQSRSPSIGSRGSGRNSGRSDPPSLNLDGSSLTQRDTPNYRGEISNHSPRHDMRAGAAFGPSFYPRWISETDAEIDLVWAWTNGSGFPSPTCSSRTLNVAGRVGSVAQMGGKLNVEQIHYLSSLSPFEFTAKLMDQIKENALCARQYLLNFFRAFPKIDLHIHSSAAIESVQFIHLAIKYNMFYAPATKMFSKRSGEGKIPAEQMYNDTKMRSEWLDLVRMSGCSSPNKSVRLQFFYKAFDYLAPILDQAPLDDLLVPIIKRAIEEEHTRHMELMVDLPLKTHSDSIRQIDPLPQAYIDAFDVNNLNQSRQVLEATRWLDRYVEIYSTYLLEGLQHSKERLNLKSVSEDPSARFTVAFLSEITRDNVSNAEFFALVMGAIKIRELHPHLLVGLNICGQEFSDTAISNLQAQLAMISFAKTEYDMPTALHANEGDTKQMSSDQIRKGLEHGLKAGVSRLGHATSLVYQEARSLAIINDMLVKDVAVEVCYAATDHLLGSSYVEESEQPFSKAFLHTSNLLIHRGVPVTFCSDDPDIYQVSLSEIFVKAARNFDFRTIENTIRAGLAHLFSPGKETLYEKNEKGFYSVKERFSIMFTTPSDSWPVGYDKIMKQRKFSIQYWHEKALQEFHKRIHSTCLAGFGLLE